LKGALSSAWDRRLDRRELLRGGAGLAVAAGLAGCGVGNIDRGSKAETEEPIKKRVDGDLVYFNYSQYIDPDLVKKFEKRYGVRVRESYFDSMPAMMAKLRAGIKYDVVFPSAEYAWRAFCEPRGGSNRLRASAGRVTAQLHPVTSVGLGGLDTPSLQGGPMNNVLRNYR
jgi:hypothetical protein